MAQPLRIGVLGGTFDPIHYGHLAIAEEARVALGLHQVVFVPAAQQPFKGHAPALPAHRLAMLRLACADNPAFTVDDLELQRPPPSYTSLTLAALQARFGPTIQLWFIMGADAAAALPRWYQVERILALASLAIVLRPGHSFDLAALQTSLPQLAARSALLDGPGLDIASSDLRTRLARGQPVRYQLPEAVRTFIAEQQVYCAPTLHD